MSLTVLVVDDSAVMRTMVSRTVRLSKLPVGEILEAGNGREALTVLHSRKVDIALVDVNMPVMNGMELLDNIRNDHTICGLPVLIVSTESSTTRINELTSKRASFLHKPFTPELLRARLLEVMEQPA